MAKHQIMDLNIKCPACNWPPDGGTHWECENCYYEFDMFEAAGKCPRCDYQHKYTQCVSWAGGCEEISLHLDWYNDIDKKLLEINIYKNTD